MKAAQLLQSNNNTRGDALPALILENPGNRKAILDALSPLGQPGDGKVFGGEGQLVGVIHNTYRCDVVPHRMVPYLTFLPYVVLRVVRF